MQISRYCFPQQSGQTGLQFAKTVLLCLGSSCYQDQLKTLSHLSPATLASAAFST